MKHRLLSIPRRNSNPWAENCFLSDTLSSFFKAKFWSQFEDNDSSTHGYTQLKEFLTRNPFLPIGAFMMARSEADSLSAAKVQHLATDVSDMIARMDRFCLELRRSPQFQLPDTWRTWVGNGVRRAYNGLNYVMCRRLGTNYQMVHEYAGVALEEVMKNPHALEALGSMPVWIFHGANVQSVNYVNAMFASLAARAYESGSGEKRVGQRGVGDSVRRDVFGSIQVGSQSVLVTQPQLRSALANEDARVKESRQITETIDFVVMLHVIGFAIMSVLLTGVMSFGLSDLPLTANQDANGSLVDVEDVPWYIALGTVLDQQTSDLLTIGLFILSLLSFKLAGHIVDEDAEDHVVITQNPSGVEGDPLILDSPEVPQSSVGQIRALHGADLPESARSEHNAVKVGAITSANTNNGVLSFRGGDAIFSNHLTIATTSLKNVPDFLQNRSPNLVPVPDHLYVGGNAEVASKARRLIRALVVANTDIPISDRALSELPTLLYDPWRDSFDLGTRLWRLVSHIKEFAWFNSHVLGQLDFILTLDNLQVLRTQLDRSTDQLFTELHKKDLHQKSLFTTTPFKPKLFTQHTSLHLSPEQVLREVVFNRQRASDREWASLKRDVNASQGDAFHHTAGRHGPKLVIQRLVDEYVEHYLRFVNSLSEYQDVDGFIDLSKVDHPGSVTGFVFTGENVDEVRDQGGDVTAAKAFGSGKTRLCMQANSYFQEKVEGSPSFIPVVKHVNGKYVYGLMSPDHLEAFMSRAAKVKENKPVKIGSYILIGAGAASLLVLGAYIRIPEECGDNDFCNTLTTNLVPEMFDFSGYLPGVIFQKMILNPLNFATVVLGFGIYSKIRHHVGADIQPINYEELQAKCDTVSGQLEQDDRAALELLMAYNAQPRLFVHENLEALSDPSEASLSSVLTQALKTGRVHNMPVCMFIASSSNYLQRLKGDMVSDVTQPGSLLQCTFSDSTELLTEEDGLAFLQTLLRMEGELNIDLSPANIREYIRRHFHDGKVKLNRDKLAQFAVSVRTEALERSPESDPFLMVSKDLASSSLNHTTPAGRRQSHAFTAASTVVDVDGVTQGSEGDHPFSVPE